jgi:hypothetical protein
MPLFKHLPESFIAGSFPRERRGVEVPRFLKVQEDSHEAKSYSEAVRRYQVQIDSSEVSCHDEIV